MTKPLARTRKRKAGRSTTIFLWTIGLFAAYLVIPDLIEIVIQKAHQWRTLFQG